MSNYKQIKFLNQFFFVLAIFFTGCVNKKNVGENMHFGLKSYSTVDEVKIYLKKMHVNFSINVSNTSLQLSDKRPKNTYTYIESNSLMDDKYTGKIELIFYNNKLMHIIFCPEKPQEYKQHLIKYKKITEISHYVKLEIIYDNKNRLCVWWTDKRLEKEESKWIEKYS